jgi:glycosyltransferase involved in cell wall biosynthesis
LFPIDWPEPFGLVLIEAMACGTPVIAWRCGSVSEIIEHGKTGFIVDSEDEAVRAVCKLDQLDRRTVQGVIHGGRDGTQLPALLLATLRSRHS